MIHNEYKWKSHDGIMLYAQEWRPESKPQAVINYVHGFKEHSSRFRKWAERFAASGYAVMAFDLRGHGHSEGRRGYARHYNDIIGDIYVFLSQSREAFPDVNHVLYGHSMGGNLVTNYLIRNRDLPDAAIIASPWFRLAQPPSFLKMAMAQIIRIILPTLTIAGDLDINALSRDPSVARDYKNDPLVHNMIRPKLFFEVESYGMKASRSIYRINIPLLVIHGTNDQLCSYKQTLNFVMNAGKRTTFREWTGAYHELHNEINEQEIFAFVMNWLKSTLH